MASSARHLFLLAFVAALAVAAPRGADAWGGRFFFSKTTRPEAAVETEKVSAATTTVPDAANPNSATAFSRPSTGGNGGRGYGLYGRPEENFPPAYFRRGVHHNAEKLTTTSNVPATEAVPVGGRGERPEPVVEEDNGSGRGRPPWTTTTLQTTTTEETVPAGGGGERAEPFVEDNGSGRGRPPWYYGPDADGRAPEEQRDNNYGMSDTRLYQNGRYHYDVGRGRYGYGRESNPVRTRPEEFGGSGFGRAGAGERRGRYGNAAGYQYGNGNGNAAGYQYGNGNEFRNGDMENQSGFQEEARDGRYIP